MASTSGESAAPTIAVTAATIEELNRLKVVARALANMAHDVNNALQIISGSVELLDSRPDLDPGVQRRIQIIGTHAARAAATVRELSAYAREDEQGPLHTDLSGVV